MDVIRVSIGSEPSQRIAAKVLKASILRRTSHAVSFSESWEPEAGWSKSMEGVPRLKNGTGFNTWRWLVPAHYGWRGRAIYLDADQVVLADIAELWNALDSDHAFAAVTNAVGIFGKKKTPEPNTVQTSVMVLDCERCDWRAANMIHDVANGRMKYKDFMQARWFDRSRIQSLPPEWNHFGLVTPTTKLLHWSHVKSQPYRNPDHPTAGIFRNELAAAIRMSLVTAGEVKSEIKRGHLHKSYMEVARNVHPDDRNEMLGPHVAGVLRNDL